MRQGKIALWTYSKELECLLFFAQRMEELLFYHTTDTYRYMALSLSDLAIEFCKTYKNPQIDKKNLKHIVDELSERLQKDTAAKKILSEEFVTRFTTNCMSWDSRTQYENISYIGRKLSERDYYNFIVDRLCNLIKENKCKKEIDKYTSLFVREVINCGYDSNYVYQVLHEVFFTDVVQSVDTINVFFEHFDYKIKKYNVYIGYSMDMSELMPLFDKLLISDLKVSMVDLSNPPHGLKIRRQQSILRFEDIESYDIYSAYEIANAISSCVVDSYNFYKHEKKDLLTYIQVSNEKLGFKTINQKNLLKERVSAFSNEDSSKKAEAFIKALFSNGSNLSDLSRISKIHNSAICSDNASDSLLSLWSVAESLVEFDKEDGDESTNSEKNNKKYGRSKVHNVIKVIVPFIKSTYIQKLVKTCMSDVLRWDKDFFEKNIRTISFGENDIEKMFAFLAFESTDNNRKELYNKTNEYPLLRYRVSILNEQLHNIKNIKAVIKEHEKRVTWHMYRIYRARNYIIHDANSDKKMNNELAINLHTYLDAVITKAVELINDSNFNDSIRTVINIHQFGVSIMDEKIASKENEKINEDNGMRYLYYDFEK